ncbi:biotin/lipoyl-binding protein [Vibrio lentus]|nr:biotin/lipoyl-binding protein [Vibrio lentus]
MAYTDSLWTRDANTRGDCANLAEGIWEITRIAVTDNQFVHAGDLLFTIDDTDYNNNVSDAVLNAKAESELNQAKE